MGNRAVVTSIHTKHSKEALGIYLHWNGGPESVLAFCDCAKALGFDSLEGPRAYGYSRFCQMIGNFFGGNCSLGIDLVHKLDTDNGDNGIYYVNEDWEIVERVNGEGKLVGFKGLPVVRPETLYGKELGKYEGIKNEILSQYRKDKYGNWQVNTPETVNTQKFWPVS